MPTSVRMNPLGEVRADGGDTVMDGSVGFARRDEALWSLARNTAESDLERASAGLSSLGAAG